MNFKTLSQFIMRTIILVLPLSLTLLTGCADLGKFIQIPTPLDQQRSVSQIPRHTLTLAQEVNASQAQGGVKITVRPIIPQPVRRIKYGPRREYPAGGLGPGQFFQYKVQAIPYYEVPGRMAFHILIENNLASPLRLKGSVVALKVGGQDINSREYQESYDELQNVMVLPRSSHEMQFVGPSYDGLSNPTSVEFGFFDVVTKLDQASNPIARGQFFWKYEYANTIETKEEPITMATMQQGPGNYDGPCRIDCPRE